VTGSDIRNRAFDGSGDLRKEAWGVLLKLLRTTGYLSSQPNAVVTDPSGASESHGVYGSGWHFHRWLGDVYGQAGVPFGDAGLFLAQNDSLTRSGVVGIQALTGKPWLDLMEEYVTAVMLVGTPAPQDAWGFTSYNLPDAIGGFTYTGKPDGSYPWPVNVAGDNLSAPFGSATDFGTIGPSGVRIYDLTSDGTGLGVAVKVMLDKPQARVVVVRLD
jgi:hypothetical protein